MEKPIGFSRAVRIGNFISVSGTAAIAPDGSTAHPNDVYGQTKYCLEIIRKAMPEGKVEIEAMETGIIVWSNGIGTIEAIDLKGIPKVTGGRLAFSDRGSSD